MPPEIRTEVVKALATSFEPNAWQSVRATDGKGPWTVIGDTLKIPQSGFVYPRNFLEKEVLLANRIENAATIPEGTELLVPPIPKSVDIDWDSPRTGAEVLDYQGGSWRSYFADASNDALLTEKARPTPNYQGAIWAYKNVPHGLLDSILNKLRPDLRQAARYAIEHFPGDQEFASIELLETAPGAGPLPTPVSAIVEKLDDRAIGIIRNNPVGDYEIWDVWSKKPGATCSHGEQVRRSALTVLNQMGVDFLAKNIIQKDIEYRQDTDIKKQLILSYLSLFTKEIKDTQSKSLDRLANFTYPADGSLRVPLLLLQAMAGLASRSSGSTLVVSQSFVVIGDTYAVLPNYYDGKLQISLLAAAKNDGAGAIEAPIYVQNEPLSTYRNRRAEGLLVVGGINQLGAPYGMTSSQGVGVTVPGLSTGWAVRTGCSDDTGNSFATPQVAAMLLAARIYWRNSNMEISATNARLRLMLSVKPTLALQGKYAAPGVPDPRRLVLRTGVFGVRNDGSIESLPIALDKAGASHLLVAARPSGQLDSLLPSIKSFALQHVDNQFLFINAEANDPSWKPVDLRDLKIPMKDGTTLDGAETFKRYQAIIGVKNEN